MQACGEPSSVPDEGPGFAANERCGWQSRQAGLRDAGPRRGLARYLALEPDHSGRPSAAIVRSTGVKKPLARSDWRRMIARRSFGLC
jgi:hypothetical protein